MLSLLRIQNLAIIEETEINFSTGLNVISGETGAGKSILLEALELLCGKRANAELVRWGAERCAVEAVIEVPEQKRAELTSIIPSLADEHEAPDELTELFIRRVIESSGKSRCYVNGALSSLKQLQALSELLIDVTRQHAQQLLLRESEHRVLLDAYGVPEELLTNVAKDFRAYSKASAELQQLRDNANERAERIGRLRSEHEELANAALQANERSEVEEELAREGNSELLMSLSDDCLQLLREGEASVERNVQRVVHLLDRASQMDSRLLEAKQLVETASIEISEAALACAEYQSTLEMDPQHIERLRERLAIIARLERKYARPCKQLCEYFSEIDTELAEYDAGAFDEQTLCKAVEKALDQLRTSESLLSQARKKVGKQLARKVEHELTQLNMKKARFEVAITPSASSLNGADSISFTLAANPGEPFQALHKVASGGELSRLLLVLKTLLATQLTPVVHVFDEIDAGMGGAVAQIVGEKLKELAQNAQVIAVTHAPQVAALASTHIAVEKHNVEGRTVSQSRVLERSQRIEHLAAMLAGKEVTAAFEESARQLLDHTTANQAVTTSKPRKKRANT